MKKIYSMSIIKKMDFLFREKLFININYFVPNFIKIN
jgi:hypothetical protein